MGLGFWIGDDDYRQPPFEQKAHWSYSGFHDFRVTLAGLAGIKLEKMAGFVKVGKWLSWDSYMSDPICLLLKHSDCDGELTAEECEKIWPRLNQLLEGSGSAMDEYDTENGFALAAMMHKCAELGVPLKFC